MRGVEYEVGKNAFSVIILKFLKQRERISQLNFTPI